MANATLQMGIDGAKAFRASLTAINGQLRALNSEMRAVVSSFTGMEQSEESIAAQSDVLQRTMDATRQKISLLTDRLETENATLQQLGEELNRVTQELGANSREAIAAQNAYNLQAAAVGRYQSQLNTAAANLNRMEREMANLTAGTEDMGNALAETENDAAGLQTALQEAFQVSLGTIDGQLNELSTRMQAVVSSFRGAENSHRSLAAQGNILRQSIAATNQRIALLNDQAQRERTTLAQLGNELERVTREFGENSREAIEAQNAYNRQRTAVSRLDSEINGSIRNLNDMQHELNHLGDDLDGAGRGARSFGSILKDAFSFGAISGAIQSFASGIASLVESTTEYRKIMGALEVSSQQAGYSAEETKEAYMQLYGVLGDEQQASTTLSNLQALGLSQEELTVLIESCIGAWTKYGDSIPIDGLAEAINETAKVGTVTGVLADVLNWATEEGEDKFNAMLENCTTEAERAQLIIDELARQGMPELAEALRQTNADLIASTEASGEFMDTMSQFADLFSPVITAVKNGISGVLQEILSFIEIGTGSAGLWGVIANLSTTLRNAAENITQELPTLIEKGSQAVTNFLEGFFLALPNLANAGMDLLGALAQSIVSALPSMAETWGQIISSLFNFLAENGPDIITKGGEILANLVKGIIDAIPDFVAQLPEIISSFLSFVLENLPAILEAGGNILLSLLQGIIENIPDLLAELPRIITSITSTLAEHLPDIIQAGFDLLLKLAEGIINAIPDLVEKLPEIISSIVETLISLAEGLWDVGKAILQGIWDGITKAKDWLFEKLGELGDWILDGIKDFFGINSPSRVMRDEVGLPIAQGVAVGIEQGAPVAEAAAQSMAKGVLSAAQEMNSVIPFAKKTAQKVGDTLQKEVDKINKKLAAMEEQAAKEQAEEELRNYQEQVAEKYKELEEAETDGKQKILDKIAKLEEEWNKKQIDAARDAAKESLQVQLEALESLQEEYEKALEDIESKQESLADKLADYGELFEEVKSETGEELFQVRDLQQDIDTIEAYGDALESLQEKSLPEGLFEEITAMGVEDAMQYMNALLAMTEEELDNYTKLYENKQAAIERVSAQVYQSAYNQAEAEYFQKLPKAAEETVSQMNQLGQSAAEAFSSGLSSQGTAMGETVEGSISQAVTESQASTGEATFLTVIEGMMEQEPLLTQYLTELKDRLIALIESFYEQFRRTGELLMEGVAQGVEDGASGLINTIIRELRRAVAAARDEMDIHSPSGVFAEIGGYMAEGMGQGFADSMRRTIRTIENSMQPVLPRAQAALEGAGPSDNRRSYSYGDINLYIDRVDNGNGRSVETLARELEFLRRRQTAAKGGERG